MQVYSLSRIRTRTVLVAILDAGYAAMP